MAKRWTFGLQAWSSASWCICFRKTVPTLPTASACFQAGTVFHFPQIKKQRLTIRASLCQKSMTNSTWSLTLSELRHKMTTASWLMTRLCCICVSLSRAHKQTCDRFIGPDRMMLCASSLLCYNSTLTSDQQLTSCSATTTFLMCANFRRLMTPRPILYSTSKTLRWAYKKLVSSLLMKFSTIRRFDVQAFQRFPQQE